VLTIVVIAVSFSARESGARTAEAEDFSALAEQTTLVFLSGEITLLD
jgi:hypothetical protein